MKYLAVLLSVVLSAFGLRAETFSVKSPDGKNEIRLSVEESLQYSVLRNGKIRVVPTAISMTIAEHGILGANAVISGKKERSIATLPRSISVIRSALILWFKCRPSGMKQSGWTAL